MIPHQADVIHVQVYTYRAESRCVEKDIAYMAPTGYTWQECMRGVEKRHEDEKADYYVDMETYKQLNREDVRKQVDKVLLACPFCEECWNEKMFFDQANTWVCVMCET